MRDTTSLTAVKTHGLLSRAVLLGALASLILSACAPSPDASSGTGAASPGARSSTHPISEMILGRWQAPEPANQDAFVEFGPEGLYLASDGCNHVDGGWQVTEDGAFSSSALYMTQIACNNFPIPQAVFAAQRISVEHDGSLVLSNSSGERMLLQRIGGEAVTIIGDWQAPRWNGKQSEISFSPDGTWKADIGCFNYRGTWSIAFQEQDARIGNHYLPKGLPTLQIGAQPADLPEQCVEPGPSVLPLHYATDYLLSVSATSFVATPVHAEAAPTDFIEFSRQGLATS